MRGFNKGFYKATMGILGGSWDLVSRVPSTLIGGYK